MSKSVKLEGTSDNLLELIFGFMSSLDTPLVNISDLVQNSIEAGADHIKIEIVHAKNEKGKGRKPKIEKVIITDNGSGFLQSFENYSKNIGDSLKKKADIYQERRMKGELTGEFCIGLHGFRSIASDLEVINLTKDSEKVVKDKDGKIIIDPDFHLMHKCRRMRLFKNKLDIIIDEEGDFSNIRTSHGVTYMLSGLTDASEKVFSVPSITQYLSNVKRNYLSKISKLKIEVTDGVTTSYVKAFTYTGNKIVHKIVLADQDKDKSRRGYGEIQAELYYHPPQKGCKIVVTVKGEPIYLDLCQKIDGFDKYPWNSGMVEGVIEYERLSKQPGRVEVQRDAFYDAFVDMLKILEKEVDIKIKEIEKSYQGKQDEKLLNKLEDVFARIKREIDLNIVGQSDKVIKGSLARIEPYPSKDNVEAFSDKILYVRAYDNEDNELSEADGIEFSWKNAGRFGLIRPQGDEAIFEAGSKLGTTEIIATVKDKNSSKELSCKIEIVIIHPIICGPLYRVKINPGVATVSIGKNRIFNAIAEDMNGNIIYKGVKYSWKIIHDTSQGSNINYDSGGSIIYSAGKRIGQVKLHLKAIQGKIIKEDFALIEVSEPKKIGKSKKKTIGLPRLRSISALEHPMWHSNLDTNEKVLYYNIAHPDYIDIQNDEHRRQRYIANLYAKELTLLECRHLGVDHYGERLIEVTARLDKYLK